MSKFQFKLESLLRLRRQVRADCRTELARACQAQSQLQSQLDQTLADIRAARRRQSPVAGLVDVGRLLDAARWDTDLCSRQTALQEQLDAMGKQVESRRQASTNAEGDVRLLEELREKLRLRHQSEQQSREAKAIDEIARVGHYRRVRG